ncbi:hypothetical protein M9Y10_023276 [Tritrichomonas musculus]|uniref:Viral A-type inclusion protein n=1 Tax=Tritrichomonas musculus TaxID=1915356 RepID=A0ABR2KVA7_9EUKA
MNNDNTNYFEENQKLRQANENLNNELSSLKSQFEKTFSLSQTLEESYKKNSELSSTIHKLKDEKEDLMNRLQIIIQSNQELQNNFEIERNNLRLSFEKENQDLKNQASDKENEFSDVIKKNNETIKSLEQKSQFLEVKFNECQLENQKMCQSLSNYFNSEINSNDDLILFLNQPKIEEPDKKAESKIENQINDINFSIELQSYENTISKLKNKSKKDRKSYEQIIEDLKRTIEMMQNDFSLKEKEYLSQFEELRNKVDRQTNQMNEMSQTKDLAIQENARLKTKIHCITHEFEAKQLNESLHHNENINSLTVKLNQAEDSNEKLKTQVPILLNQLKFFKNTAKSLKEKVTDLEKSIDSLTAENNKNVEQIYKLKKEIETKDKDISEINKKNNEIAIQLKKYVNLLKDKTTENAKLKAAFEHSTVEMEAQKNEFFDVKNERDELLNTVTQNESKITSLESKVNEILNKNKNLENELIIAQKKLVVSSEPINETSLLPLTTWAVGTFPNDLAEMITKISDNQTLQTPSKLKHIFSIIMEWYQKKDERVNNEIESIKQKIFDMETNESLFVKYLSNIFEKDYSNIFTDEALQRDLDNYVSNLKIEIKKNDQKVRNYESEMIDFLVFMNADNLIKAKEKVEKLNRKIQKLKENLESHKIKIADLLKSHKIKEKEFQTSLSKRQKENNQLKSEIDKSHKTIQSLQIEISSIQSKSEEKSAIDEQKMHNASVEFEAKIAEFERQNNVLSEKVQEVTKLREKTEESKVELKTEINQLQKSIQHLSQKNDEKNQEIQQIKTQSEEKIRRFHDIIQSDREVFKQKEKRYKALIQKMIKENNEEREKKQNQVNDLENQNESLKSQNDELSIQIHSLNMKIQTIEADFERQKRLLESQMKTDLLSKEVAFNSQLEECRKKLHEVKVNLMGFIASQFCSLFNTKEKLDETNFEVFIQNISKKLSSLMDMEWRLRELLQLGPRQSIEDAVSSLLLRSQENRS